MERKRSVRCIIDVWLVGLNNHYSSLLHFIKYKPIIIVKWKSLGHVQLCDLMYYTVHGILQARILEWEAFPFSRESSQPRDQIMSPELQTDS